MCPAFGARTAAMPQREDHVGGGVVEMHEPSERPGEVLDSAKPGTENRSSTLDLIRSLLHSESRDASVAMGVIADLVPTRDEVLQIAPGHRRLVDALGVPKEPPGLVERGNADEAGG